jgi:hypothetical protein
MIYDEMSAGKILSIELMERCPVLRQIKLHGYEYKQMQMHEK